MPGKTGAKRQSYKASNPRALFDQLKTEHPEWGEGKLFEVLCEEFEANRDYRYTIYDYWFGNTLDSWLGRKSKTSEREHSPRRNPTPQQRSQYKKEREAMVEEIKAKFDYLTMMMPNGKMLKDCTGTECINHISPFIRDIGKRVGKRRVGVTLTNEMIEEINKNYIK